jgi:lipooligosaccharide transport system permease protein
MTTLRVLPRGLYAGRARAVVERTMTVNGRTWLTVLSGFFEPLFYLLGLGYGFAKLVGDVTGPDGTPIGYLRFMAPGLLAAATMNGAVTDASINVYFRFRYYRIYDVILATPLGPVDVAIGEITCALLRGGMYAAAFLVVMLALGLIGSWWALLALPAALLIALGFAAVAMAAATFFRSWQDIDLVQLAVVPMFLFATTFYPLTVYPDGVRWLVQCLPLYHGVALMRGLTTGYLDPWMLGHIGYFVVMALVGGIVTARRLGKLLLS